jgi:hypothetical protein
LGVFGKKNLKRNLSREQEEKRNLMYEYNYIYIKTSLIYYKQGGIKSGRRN